MKKLVTIAFLSSDKYYVGYSNDPYRRLIVHNTKPYNTYTSKHRPWILRAVFFCSDSESEAINLERFIKKQKSKSLLEKLCEPTFILQGVLSKLARVPHNRDPAEEQLYEQ